MIRRSWMIGASIETTRELWASSLREVKKRISPLFAQERAALNAGLFVDGLLGDGVARLDRCARRRRATLVLGGSRRFWGAIGGMPTRCVTWFATMLAIILQTGTR